jgi:serine phosphatase RsbU (regulator of sigma subunit)
MLELKDFFHLPQVDVLVEQVLADGPGLILVAGLDPRPLAASAAAGGFLPSGRSAIFRILVRYMLAADHGLRAIVVAETKDTVRISRQLRQRTELALVKPPATYADEITAAARRRPDLLVIDRLDAESASAALQVAQSGLRVLSQMDTVFCGADTAHHLLDLGVPRERLAGLAAVVAIQRLATLCPICKEPELPNPEWLAEMRRRYLALPLDATFFRAVGCDDCKHTGRKGDVAAFDIFQASADTSTLFEQPSLLSLEEYVLHLAALGYVSVDDVIRLDFDQLHRTYSLLSSSEHALADANATLQRKLVELEAANRVLRQRTEALISLQDTGTALATSTDLADLAARICRHACDLCGADRAILYLLRPDGQAEVLAVSGWHPELIHQQVNWTALFGVDPAGPDPLGSEPAPFDAWPPGVPARHPDMEGASLRAGLRVPLIAQQEVTGLMLVHTAQKPRFTPGEIALLQAFANQAAVAVQRTGLIEALRGKIAQLEAAQAELVKKERLERELELARQVQQSLLPRIFPMAPGYKFAARNEPARQVGGDFYDVILLDADRFGVAIADVSDKGMPAALFMTLTRSLLLAEARRERSPRSVLINVHRLLLELGRPEMFVTLFYGVIEGTARRLTYARAGHERPILLRGGVAQELGGEGGFLGYLLDVDELHLSEEQVDLLPGDRLVLYTDGLIDVMAPDSQRFGRGRLVPLIESHAQLAADELCAVTFASLAAYQDNAEQYDDMTMLVVEVA